MSLRDALKIPARQITEESVYQGRRTLLQAFAMAPALTLAGSGVYIPAGWIKLEWFPKDGTKPVVRF